MCYQMNQQPQHHIWSIVSFLFCQIDLLERSTVLKMHSLTSATEDYGEHMIDQFMSREFSKAISFAKIRPFCLICVNLYQDSYFAKRMNRNL